MKIKLNYVLPGLLACATLVPTSQRTVVAEVVGKSIALVNGEAIFLSEFEKNWSTIVDQRKRMTPGEELSPEIEATQKKQLLDQMVEEKLLLQEAEKRKIKVPKRQLEEGTLQVKNRFKILPPGAKPTKAEFERPLTPAENIEFQKELKKQDLSEKDFEKKIEGQLKTLQLTDEEVRNRVSSPFKEALKPPQEGEEEPARELTPEYEKEAKTIYDQIEKKFNDKTFKPNPENEIDQMVEMLKSKLGETVHARHILISSSRDDDFKTRSAALNKINAIKKQLDNGADFAELAQKNSQGPGSKNGGDLGFFTRGQMVPEFDKVAFDIPVGGMSGVIETQFGYHIIQVEEKKAAQKLRFDSIKMDLAGYLYQKRGQERYEQFVGDLKKKADIKILYDFALKKN